MKPYPDGNKQELIPIVTNRTPYPDANKQDILS